MFIEEIPSIVNIFPYGRGITNNINPNNDGIKNLIKLFDVGLL